MSRVKTFALPQTCFIHLHRFVYEQKRSLYDYRVNANSKTVTVQKSPEDIQIRTEMARNRTKQHYTIAPHSTKVKNTAQQFDTDYAQVPLGANNSTLSVPPSTATTATTITR